MSPNPRKFRLIQVVFLLKIYSPFIFHHRLNYAIFYALKCIGIIFTRATDQTLAAYATILEHLLLFILTTKGGGSLCSEQFFIFNFG